MERNIQLPPSAQEISKAYPRIERLRRMSFRDLVTEVHREALGDRSNKVEEGEIIQSIIKPLYGNHGVQERLEIVSTKKAKGIGYVTEYKPREKFSIPAYRYALKIDNAGTLWYWNEFDHGGSMMEFLLGETDGERLRPRSYPEYVMSYHMAMYLYQREVFENGGEVDALRKSDLPPFLLTDETNERREAARRIVSKAMTPLTIR